MTKMPMRQFVRENRDEITKKIQAALGKTTYPVSELERIMWVTEDHKLNKWAKSKGME